MAANRRRRAVSGSLASAVDEMVSALPKRPQDAPLVALARLLACTLDEMPGEVRQRMLGQTSGALLSVLRELREGMPAVPIPVPSKLDELQARRALRAARAGAPGTSKEKERSQ